MKHSPLLGAHVSIAGGVDRAIARGQELGCRAIQIFVKSNVRWQMSPLRSGERERFEDARRKSDIGSVFAHSSYLINLASPDRKVVKKSISSLAAEISRAAMLELPFIVLHPGAHGGEGVETGIRKIADGLDEIFEKTLRCGVRVVLETTAGQGSGIGGRFEEIASIVERSSHQERIGVFFDTCHVFASGYDIRGRRNYRWVMDKFDRIIGIDRLAGFHLNDSKGGLGSRVDRHEQIGKGALGLEVFAMILNDRRFIELPMVIETPKGSGTSHDRRNLRLLRSLIKL